MIAVEHTLVILLLLVGLLNAKPKFPRLGWAVVILALTLALVSPVQSILLPWDWLSALLIPVLLWQAAQRMTRASLPLHGRELALWLGMALGIGGLLMVTSEMGAAGCLMFGLLAASMVWRATEEDTLPSHLGQIGPLALAFLLVEIAPAVEAPDRYLVALIAGGGLGALVGFVAVHAAEKIPHPGWRNIFSIGQVYVGYTLAAVQNLSGVVAAMMCVAVFIAYGTRRSFWANGSIQPKPLDSTPVYLTAVMALAFFAWQIHIPVTPILLLEIGLGLIFTVLTVWVGRRLHIEPFLRGGDTYARVLFRVGFLLVPAILLWPREALLDPLPLVIALGAATLAAIWAHYTLVPLLNTYTWLEKVTAAEAASASDALLVGDLMDRDCITVDRDTPATELARLFTQRQVECLPVVDVKNRLVGIVTQSDLFVREEPMSLTGQTYPSVFKEPIDPDHLAEVYAQRGSMYTAADLMSTKLIWIQETATLGQAVRLMLRYGYNSLPVLQTMTESGGTLAGIITRSGILRLLASAAQSG